MTDKQLARLKEIPEHLHKLFTKVFTSPTRSKAIQAKCYDCCCYNRAEVHGCETTTCPLFAYCPKPKSKD